MSEELYYTPAPQECFEELQARAIELWHEVDTDNDKYGYATSKINRIKNIENVGDNFMHIVAMFDYGNQRTLADRVSSPTRHEVRVRMISGGTSEDLLTF